MKRLVKEYKKLASILCFVACLVLFFFLQYPAIACSENMPVSSPVERQPAFPGAEGFGRFALGGRGGDVYYVTSLNDNGPGSFRHGIETANGPRTILFSVSGNIALKSNLVIDKPFITVAGQTTPGDGITLKNYQLSIAADHVVVRFLRSRLGDLGTGSQPDAIRIGSGSNIIIDHCSVSWGIDETLSASANRVDSLTVQWSIVSESLHRSRHPKGPHGMGGVIRAWRQTYHHNLFAHHNSRPPKIAWRHFIEVDFRNNVIYNWGSLGPYDGSSAHVNWANNYYKPGPGTHPKVRELIFRIDNKTEQRNKAGIEEVALFYIEGNVMHGSPLITENNWAGVWFYGDPGFNEERNRAPSPFPYPAISYETTAIEAFENVLARAGASLARDRIDQRIVKETRDGTATYGFQKHLRAAGQGPHGIIDSQNDVGGWPELRSLDPPVDSDGDGIPDWWEIELGLDPNDPADGKLDRNGDGYTNLEEYLDWLVNPGDRFPERYPFRQN